MIPGFFTPGLFINLGALYTFGSLLAFAFAHASIITLRVKAPDLSRPFKVGLNIKVKGREIPITAVLGLLATGAVWLVIVAVQPFGRWVGLGWMVVGVAIYWFYRHRKSLSPSGSMEEPVNRGELL